MAWQPGTRQGFAVCFAIGAVFFGYATMTVPAIAATAPAMLTIACGVVSYLLWPKKSAATREP